MTESLPPIRGLMLISMALPAAITASNLLLLNHAPNNFLHYAYYPWMILSIAVLSHLAGRLLNPFWLSCVVFVWSLMLLDLLTVIACVGGTVDREMGFALVSAEVSLIALWSILGIGNWQLRLPAALVTLPLVNILMHSLEQYYRFNWTIIIAFCAAVMAILCGGLRSFGFAMMLEMSVGVERPATAPPKKTSLQFGVKHMLIWLTAMGPLILIARSLDLQFEANFAVALVGLSAATLNLTAIWSVLGSGPAWLRLASLIAIPLGIAAALNAYSAHLASSRGSYWSPSNSNSLTFATIEMHGRWFSWCLPAAALLAALLLFLRARGYRLMRLAKTPARATIATP